MVSIEGDKIKREREREGEKEGERKKGLVSFFEINQRYLHLNLSPRFFSKFIQ